MGIIHLCERRELKDERERNLKGVRCDAFAATRSHASSGACFRPPPGREHRAQVSLITLPKKTDSEEQRKRTKWLRGFLEVRDNK